MPAGSSRRRSRRWIGFFLVLSVLGAAAVIVPIIYNLSIQLKPEQLADARRRWRENAPADYDLEYLVKSEQSGEAALERAYFVRVRTGRVVSVAESGEVVYLDPSLSGIAGPAPLGMASDDPRRYGVSALFDAIEAALGQDETTGRRNFATASFDPRDGHPFHYIHRVRGTKDRMEWHVKLTRAAPGP